MAQFSLSHYKIVGGRKDEKIDDVHKEKARWNLI